MASRGNSTTNAGSSAGPLSPIRGGGCDGGRDVGRSGRGGRGADTNSRSKSGRHKKKRSASVALFCQSMQREHPDALSGYVDRLLREPHARCDAQGRGMRRVETAAT